MPFRSVLIDGSSREPISIVTSPNSTAGTGDRIAAAGIEHEAVDQTTALVIAGDNRKLAVPDLRERDLVVSIIEVGVVAGDQEVRPGRNVVWRGNLLHAFLVVLCFRQVG